MTTAAINALTVVLDPYAVDENGKALSLPEFAKFVIQQAHELREGENIVFNYRGISFSPRKIDPATGKPLFTAHWLTDALRHHLPIDKWNVRFDFVKGEDGKYSHHQYEIVRQVPAEQSTEDLGDPAKLFG